MEKLTPTALPSRRITKAEVQITHTQVYSNGRQQVRVGLYMEAEDNGATTELTLSEINSLRIVNYDTDEEVPLSNDGSSTYNGWSAQTGHRGYDYLDEGSLNPEPEVESNAPGKVYYLYLSGNDQARLFPLKLAFSVTMKDVKFITTGKYIENGATLPYSGIDSYGHEIIRALSPVQYTASDFNLDQGTDTPAIFNREVRLTLKPGGARTLGIRDLVCEPAGMIHWEHEAPGQNVACYTGYAKPGETTLHWNVAVPIGGQPRPPRIAVAMPNVGTIMVCGRNDIHHDDHSTAPKGPILLRVVDAYGSDQVCQLAFEPGIDKNAQLKTQ